MLWWKQVSVVIIVIAMLSVLSVSGANATLADDVEIYIDGARLDTGNEIPRIVEGRVLLPMRRIFENLGAEVSWDAETRTVTGTRENPECKIVLPVGSKSILINGQKVEIDVPAVIHGSRTYVPIRVVTESLDNQIRWDESNRRVLIERQGYFHDKDEDENGQNSGQDSGNEHEDNQDNNNNNNTNNGNRDEDREDRQQDENNNGGDREDRQQNENNNDGDRNENHEDNKQEEENKRETGDDFCDRKQNFGPYYEGEYHPFNLTGGLTKDEQALANLINAYRIQQGKKPFLISKSLTEVARWHVWDSHNHYDIQWQRDGTANLHSWSNQGFWQGMKYTSDHRYASLMNSKPREITDYPGGGGEISYWNSHMATPERALNAWIRSDGHRRSIERDRNVMGVGISGNYAHVWFGREEDPAGYYCR